MNIHWRYNYDYKSFIWVDGNPNQSYQPLMDHVAIPTLIIDINLVKAIDLESNKQPARLGQQNNSQNEHRLLPRPTALAAALGLQ